MLFWPLRNITGTNQKFTISKYRRNIYNIVVTFNVKKVQFVSNPRPSVYYTLFDMKWDTIESGPLNI